jgi:hypothetical protein
VRVQVDLLNLTLGASEDAELFWKEDMLPLLETKFEGFMAAENSPGFNLKVQGFTTDTTAYAVCN